MSDRTARRGAIASRCVVVLRPAVVSLAAALGLVTATSARPSAAQAREQQVVAAVVDAKNAPVADVAAGDLVVREDRIAREILGVAPAALPSHLVLLVDDSQATDGLTMELRDGIEAFVTTLTAGGGQPPAIQLMTFGDRPTTRVAFTTSVDRIAESAKGLFPRAGAGATLLEGILEATGQLRARKPERGVIVAFVAERGPEFSSDRHEQVEEALKQTRTALWSVVLQDPAGQDTSDAGRERSIVLSDVATASGGLTATVLNRQGIAGGFETVARAIAGQVAITYARPDTLIPPTRLEVSARQPSVRVIAPHWTGQ